MIISASRRTDIPAFFSDWFFNRLKDGFVVTQNPFNANQLSKIRLDCEVVDAIVFWTKNPKPMLSRLDELDKAGIVYYFQYTVTPYGRDLEPHLPSDKGVLIDTFRALSEAIGSDRIVWRYDPILFSEKYSLDFHQRAFTRCSELLDGYTSKCVISFLDMDYGNTRQINQLGIRDGSTDEKNAVARIISAIAKDHGIVVETCAEEIDLAGCGVDHGHCVDADLIEKISGRPFARKGKQKDKAQRLLCGCVASTDIGAYNTCMHGCVYCYANYSKGAIESNVKRHDATSPLLLGTCDAASIEFRKGQASFFDSISATGQTRLLLDV